MKASEFQSSRKFVQTAFGRVAYVERGNGPVALFVHALPALRLSVALCAG